MSEQENVQTVRKAYDAFARGDIATLMEMVHEDVEWETPGDSKIIPHAGKRRGRDAVKEFFMLVGENEEVQKFEAHEFFAQGDRVAATATYAGRVRSTGKPFSCEIAHFFTIRDGKLASFREYYDTAESIEAYTK